MPSGVTMPAALNTAFTSGERRHSMIECTGQTHTYDRAFDLTQPSMRSSACCMSIALTPTPSTLTRSAPLLTTRRLEVRPLAAPDALGDVRARPVGLALDRRRAAEGMQPAPAIQRVA